MSRKVEYKSRDIYSAFRLRGTIEKAKALSAEIDRAIGYDGSKRTEPSRLDAALLPAVLYGEIPSEVLPAAQVASGAGIKRPEVRDWIVGLGCKQRIALAAALVAYHDRAGLPLSIARASRLVEIVASRMIARRAGGEK